MTRRLNTPPSLIPLLVLLVASCATTYGPSMSGWDSHSENVTGMQILVESEKGEDWPAVLGSDAVLFESDRAGNIDIWMVKLSSPATAMQLTTASGPDRYPTAHPDRKHFVFLSTRSGTTAYYLGEVGKPIAQLLAEVTAPNLGGWTPAAMRPDGKAIAYTSGEYLWTLNIETGTRTQLWEGYRPTWSPDGQHLYFRKKVHQFAGAYVSTSIWRASPDGTSMTKLIVGGSENSINEAVVSPDGTRILYVPARVASGTTGRFGRSDLWMCNSDGTGHAQITTNPFGDYHPSWIDNNRVVFVSDRPPSGHDWEANANLWVLTLP